MRPSRACAARSLLCAREACTMLCAAHVRARAGVRGRRRSAVVARGAPAARAAHEPHAISQRCGGGFGAVHSQRRGRLSPT